MKVLVVLPQPPLDEGGAPGRCSIGLLRGLRAHGIEVTAVAARRSLLPHEAFALDGSRPPADLPVELVDVPAPVSGWSNRLEILRRPNGYLSRGAFGERVRELSGSADVLHLEESHTGWCDLGSTTPALVHPHYLARLDEPLPPPWRKEFLGAALHRAGELLIARRHRYLVASSPVVAAQLEALAPEAETVVAPLSLDPARYDPAPLDGEPVAGIIGTASWPPTRRAIRRLVWRVWPLVRRQLPDARLRIAGRGTAEMGLDGAEGVEVVGTVPAAAEFLRGLSLLLYPAERGSGMKVKVLESIACGLPVVTTPSGAEGVEAGEGVVVRHSDEELAAAAVSLLSDESERRQRGSEARAAFLARYAPEVATAPLVDLYRRMAASA